MRSECKSKAIELLECRERLDNASNQSMENFESFHMRYLDEIKAINSTMAAFRVEKNQEIRAL